jgi:hypothetical protein
MFAFFISAAVCENDPEWLWQEAKHSRISRWEPRLWLSHLPLNGFRMSVFVEARKSLAAFGVIVA